MTLPPGACDTHIHVFDRAHPIPGMAPEAIPHAPASAYRAVQHATGLSRAVLVQANGYRDDNSVMLDAIEELGREATRAIAVVRPDAGRDVFAELDRSGVCGIRVHALPGGFFSVADVPQLAPLSADLGWHVQLQLDGRTLPENVAMLGALPCPLVIDHIGKFLEPVPVEHPGFQALLRLIDTGRVWVKLSAPYEVSRAGPPGYTDVSALASALARAAPERMLFATNWPHPWRDDAPSEAALLALFAAWVPDAAARQRILVDNAAEVYGFA